MSAFFAVLFTFLEVAVTAFSYLTRAQAMFADMVIYGSPFYLLMNAFNPGSPFINGPKIYLAYFVFHVLKYFAIFRSRIVDEYPRMWVTAVFFEIIYLATSAYYLY